MLVFFCCPDRPGMSARRRAARAEHLEYMIKNQEKIVFGGPVSVADGEPGVGSVFVLDLSDLDAAQDFLADEPYHRAGLFESVIVRPFRQMSPEPRPGHLRRELERERAEAQGRPA